ncbi:hypothetical protein [Psychrobacillus sp. PGGUH221]|uniref:hypothetical protein n=1 Tax=Psychrobacillus sp. PGGUH221 TaxID=3020058 RepID=UPI0035C77296
MRQLNEKIDFRAYVEDDFESIHLLNIQEEWNNLVAKKEDTKNAWSHSNVAFVEICQWSYNWLYKRNNRWLYFTFSL